MVTNRSEKQRSDLWASCWNLHRLENVNGPFHGRLLVKTRKWVGFLFFVVNTAVSQREHKHTSWPLRLNNSQTQHSSGSDCSVIHVNDDGKKWGWCLNYQDGRPSGSYSASQDCWLEQKPFSPTKFSACIINMQLIRGHNWTYFSSVWF